MDMGRFWIVKGTGRGGVVLFATLAMPFIQFWIFNSNILVWGKRIDHIMRQEVYIEIYVNGVLRERDRKGYIYREI